nr:hypothetical protein CFP56_54431 [Quercus suber]
MPYRRQVLSTSIIRMRRVTALEESVQPETFFTDSFMASQPLVCDIQYGRATGEGASLAAACRMYLRPSPDMGHHDLADANASVPRRGCGKSQSQQFVA